MQSNLSQTNGPRENLETPKSSALKLVFDKSRMAQVRQEIKIVADRSYRNRLINDETYDGYRELAGDEEGEMMSLKMLENTREFAEEHERRAIETHHRIHRKFLAAQNAGIASKADEEFLVEAVVFDNVKLADKIDKIEEFIDEKLARMKKDREAYDKLAGHELIKDIGYLKVDGSTRIDFPNAQKFLEMTVPERRKLLKQLEEALPKAEAYAENHADEASQELIDSYEEKLNEEREKGNIGEHTYKKFLKGIKSDKIDNKEREYWHSEFDNQMKPYRTLWTQIPKTLQGEARKSIEDMRDTHGYTALFAEFGKLKDSESKRLRESYAGELEKYRTKGIIGQHTLDEFDLWIEKQDFPQKYEAKGQLPGQMADYETLWKDIDTLDKGQQNFIRSKIDVWGYTELNQQYQAFKSGAPIPQTEVADSDPDSLSQLESKEVKNAILETDEMLGKQGKSKRKAFMSMLDKMYNKVSRNSFDASGFKANLEAKAANDNAVEKTTKSREADNEVDFHEIEKNTGILRKRGANVTEDLGFIQVESKDGSRTTQATINEEKAMEHLFTEDSKHEYRSEEEGGEDKLSLAFKTDSSRTVEMKLQEIRALHKHLKKSEEQEKLDKAA